jgi:hypothetical protein
MMFRDVMPFGVGRAARVEERRDGRGNVSRVEISNHESQISNRTLSGRAAEGRTANARALPHGANPTDSGALELSTRGTAPADPTDANPRPRPGCSLGLTAPAVPRVNVGGQRPPLQSRRPSRMDLLETPTP